MPGAESTCPIATWKCALEARSGAPAVDAPPYWRRIRKRIDFAHDLLRRGPHHGDRDRRPRRVRHRHRLVRAEGLPRAVPRSRRDRAAGLRPERVHSRQTDLLKVQADELELQRQQFDQQQADRRRDQASRIIMRTGTDPALAITQAQCAAAKLKSRQVTVHIATPASSPSYDLTVNWRKGTAPGMSLTASAILMPGPERNFSRNLPDNLPPDVDRSLYSAAASSSATATRYGGAPAGRKIRGTPAGAEPPTAGKSARTAITAAYASAMSLIFATQLTRSAQPRRIAAARPTW